MAIIMTACLCTESFALMANAESNRVFANVISFIIYTEWLNVFFILLASYAPLWWVLHRVYLFLWYTFCFYILVHHSLPTCWNSYLMPLGKYQSPLACDENWQHLLFATHAAPHSAVLRVTFGCSYCRLYLLNWQHRLIAAQTVRASPVRRLTNRCRHCRFSKQERGIPCFENSSFVQSCAW